MTTTLDRPTKTKRPPRMRDVIFGDVAFGQNGEKSEGRSQRAEVSSGEAELLTVAIGLIEPSPYQARQNFDATELAELTASIQTHGLAQPPLVRPVVPHGGSTRYELVEGERRWRACKIAGLAHIPVYVRQLTDDQAAELGLVANEKRKDLNPIERARGYQAWLTRTGGTQQQLADRLGVTQGQISNCVRLLELPPAVQKYVISGDIPTSVARMFVPYVGPVMDQIAKEIAKPANKREAIDNEWDAKYLIREAIRHAGEDIHEMHYVNSRPAAMRKLTEEEYLECRIISVPGTYDDEKPKEIATNKKAYKKLWDAHVAALKSKKSKAGDKQEQKAAKVAKTLTPAELKAKRAESAKQLVNKIGRWKTDWLRKLCALEILGNQPAQARLLIYLASYRHNHFDLVEEAVKGVVKQFKKGRWGIDVLATLCAEGDAAVRSVCANICRLALWDEKEGPANTLRGESVDQLAQFLRIEMDVAWDEAQKDTRQTSRSTESYLDLHTREQLVDQAVEWKIQLGENLPKSGMIGHLTSPGKRLKIPKALVKAKCV